MDNLNDNASLTPEQMDRILQFQNITAIADPAVCRDVLQRHYWNLEIAVQEQLNITEGKPSLYASTTRPPVVVNDISGRVYHSASSMSITTSLHSFFRNIIRAVTNFWYDSLQSILTSLMRIVGADGRRYLTCPVQDVMQFIRMYRSKYSKVHPVFYQGTFSQVLIDAKRELKFLLVYLHNEDTMDTDVFCREALTDSSVIKYINQNFLFWACTSRNAEPHVLEMFGPRNYPFLAIVVLKEGCMTIVVRMEGFCSAESLHQRLVNIVKDFQPYLDATRSDRIELTCCRTVKTFQDQAYKESLLEDQEKERKLQEERMVPPEEVCLKEAISRERLEAAGNIPEEPLGDDPNAVHIVIKLACGTRLERRFLKTNSLEAIYSFVLADPNAPDAFEITTNFPKRVLECRPTDLKPFVQSIEEAGLENREVLFVNDLEG